MTILSPPHKLSQFRIQTLRCSLSTRVSTLPLLLISCPRLRAMEMIVLQMVTAVGAFPSGAIVHQSRTRIALPESIHSRCTLNAFDRCCSQTDKCLLKVRQSYDFERDCWTVASPPPVFDEHAMGIEMNHVCGA